MNDITTLPAEKEDLGLHVDLCAQRYNNLEHRLKVLEAKFDRLGDEIITNKKSLAAVIITASAAIVTSLLGLMATILLKF